MERPVVGAEGARERAQAIGVGDREIGVNGEPQHLFDGVGSLPDGLQDVAGYPALLAELARRGWTDPELAKLTWHNALRVLRATEAVAGR